MSADGGTTTHPRCKYVAPFPPTAALSSEDRELMRRIAETTIANNVAEFSEFQRYHRDRKPSRRQWKMLKETDRACVYLERSTRRRSDCQVLLGIGTREGSLEDALYGCMAYRTETMRIRGSFFKMSVVSAAMLDVIDQPTAAKPLHSLTVMWTVKEMPMGMGKPRDSVCLEATGITQSEDGERIGYRLLHTVDLAQFPPTEHFHRSKMSVLYLIRQADEKHLETYCKAFVSAPETLFSTLYLRSYASVIMTVPSWIELARMKKTRWLLRHHAEQPAARQAHCSACRRDAGSVLSQHGYTCRFCGQTVCFSCRTKQSMFTIVNDNLCEYEVFLCKPCIRRIDDIDTAAVASEEAAHFYSHPHELHQDYDDLDGVDRNTSMSIVSESWTESTITDENEIEIDLSKVTEEEYRPFGGYPRDFRLNWSESNSASDDTPDSETKLGRSQWIDELD